ncbi:hypothetical protein RRG08_042266 [Elysia crispata]|uniref:G-protein coupled receptors family 1 profile domain-containing protein n=1 Tax=Elysia crispata TaxID=231223 RepID=A0AAE1AJL7_9GAST|nr:hypothetical protein RRG08_042266 [Elysia crispata]
MIPTNSNSSSPRDNNTVSQSTSLDYSTQTTEKILDMVSPILWFSIALVGTFGIIGNILNLIVYVKLGFSETIHVSYAAMVISDIGCILTAMWFGMACFSAIVQFLLADYRIHTDWCALAGLTGAWPHNAFSRTTALFTAWISLERCLGVMYPTRVKLLITSKVTKVLILIIYIAGLGPLSLVYVHSRVVTIFDPLSNYSTLLFYYNAKNELPHNVLDNGVNLHSISNS